MTLFGKLASGVSKAAGRPAAFALSVATIVAWALTGPMFRYSDTWQIVINTGTTIITFLMVFLIQNTQNRDGAAIQLKLDTVILALERADNRVIGIEERSEEEALALRATIRDPSPV